MSARFNIQNTPLQGLRLIETKPMGDNRGSLERLFCEEEFSDLLMGKKISQINQTNTINKGTVRGMHFQFPPHSETKIIKCIEGEVFDVAVDLRKKSPTFLQWHSEILSSDNSKIFYIPDGFAHGFQTLSDNCKMLYFHTFPYNKESEGGVRPTDPGLNIRWPLPVELLSDRDGSHPLIDNNFSGIVL
ncbi:MAG: dTDP-4-dehydrorhamnose 3,5-epimerase family protein [Rhodospirillaceae bacterium]|nr:dTDP-4-dehydrorhamnose 3,5-epimerase family protein [Rhodospirillaceae bacterium]